MFERDDVIVSGRRPLARLVTEQIRSAGRRARQVDDLPAAGGRLRAAGTLVLADPVPDATDLATRLGTLCRRRSRRLPPLSVLLLHSGAPHPALPHPNADAPFTLAAHDLDAHAARACFDRWPLHAGMDPPFGQAVHLLIAGNAPPAIALAVHALRLMHYGETRPVLSFVARDPDALKEEWLASFPEAGQLCRLRFTSLARLDLTEAPPVTGAFVWDETPERGLDTAHRLVHLAARQQSASPLVLLETGRGEPEGDVGDWDGQIVPFSWLREACRPEILLDGRDDDLARVIHDHYRDSIAAQGRDPAEEPAGRPWEILASSYRDANRHQADHLWAKLAVTDCRAVAEELVESFAFAPLEVERLAVIEHARWAADRYLDGWTYAPERDNVLKQHPQLIPYRELSEPMKDLDRFAVRLAPTLLARSGRGIVRILLVGVQASGAASQGLRRLADQVLKRLTHRYPDRSLVLASTLVDDAARLLVRRGVERHGAGLFLLCPAALSSTLSTLPDDRARRDFLALAARAERRIPLAGAEDLARWLGRRAEITVSVGPAAAESQTKRVRIDPAGGRAEWSFEY